MLHPFHTHISGITLPTRFTYPFCYTPHPLCVRAAEEVQQYLAGHPEWGEGKMFGVLAVQTDAGEVGYLAAFSGILAGKNRLPFFVPPVYDLLQPDGFFKQEEAEISALNARIAQMEQDKEYLHQKEAFRQCEAAMRDSLDTARQALKAAKAKREERRRSPALTSEEADALVRESQFQKAEYKRLERGWKERMEELRLPVEIHEARLQALKHERKTRSADLQLRLFRQFRLLNYRGEVKDLCEIFADTVQRIPPAGAGECAAPKLLQYAYLHGWKPLAMAEFWWGAPSQTEVRQQGCYYPSCTGKCGPILRHMLQGLDVEDNPLGQGNRPDTDLEIIYEDETLLVVNKPSGLLSVPGKEAASSVQALMQGRHPQALAVHRLDMDTSGLLLIAKTKEAYRCLQAQFEQRLVRKRYIALLDGLVPNDRGSISLPLRPDLHDRPRQVADLSHGKPAITDYEVLERRNGRTLIAFYPQTGRTHQLRVHAAHPLGLHCPIVGDALYGMPAERLCLHAEKLEFTHPATGERMAFQAKAGF